jgi:hypothetical protein
MTDPNTQALLPLPEYVAIPIPGLPSVKIIKVIRSFSEPPISEDENLILRLHAEVERLRAYAQAAVLAERDSGWISIEERLPEKFIEVLIAFKTCHLAATGQYTGDIRDSADGWSYPSENGGNGDDWTVTHWRPLPEAPAAIRARSEETITSASPAEPL